MENSPFEPTCYSNIVNMVNEFSVYLKDIIEKCVPRRTTHRQTFPSRFTSETSHLLEKLETQRKLLKLKPTAYRKQKIKTLETEFWKSREQDRIDYQTKIAETRNTDLMFKHFKRMSKEPALSSTVVLNGQESNSVEETLNIFNKYFQSFYSPKNKSLSDIYCKDPKTTNFDTSFNTIRKYLDDLDETKSKGPDGIPPLFIKNLAAPLSKALNLIFRNIKSQNRIPKKLKISAISPIHKKSSKKDVSIYRPVAILDTFEKIFKKCLYSSIYDCFSDQITSQHGFVKNKSVETNLLSFLQKVYNSYDDPTTKSLIALYADMAKAFDKIPHYELIQKVSKIGIGGCLPEVLKDYLTDRYQIVRYGNERSDQLLITSGVPQGSVIGPLMFLIFINDLPDYLIYSEPSLYADDLKSIVKNNKELFQLDLDNLTKWGVENKMSFAVKGNKCFMVTFRGTTEEPFYLSNSYLSWDLHLPKILN